MTVPLLRAPVRTVLPGGTVIMSHVDASTNLNNLVLSRRLSVSNGADTWREPHLPKIPGRSVLFAGSILANDETVLVQVSGVARSYDEGADRVEHAWRVWSERFSETPEGVTRPFWDRPSGHARIAVADELCAVVAEYATFPSTTLIGVGRRAKKACKARVESAWSAYQDFYPEEGLTLSSRGARPEQTRS